MSSVEEELHAAIEDIERATLAPRELRRSWSSPREGASARSQQAIEEAAGRLAAAGVRVERARAKASEHVWRPAKE